MSKECTERYNFFDTIANIGTTQNAGLSCFMKRKCIKFIQYIHLICKHNLSFKLGLTQNEKKVVQVITSSQ